MHKSRFALYPVHRLAGLRPALRFISPSSAPFRHPGPRAGVHLQLPMLPQPVETGIDLRSYRENRGWTPARGPG